MANRYYMNGQSLDITKELLEQLKKLVPQAFSEDKLDVTQLKTLLGEDIFVQNERYGLSWAGKNEAYQVMQQPTLATLEPQPEASIDWENAEHLFIEGENLEVLKLLQKSYFGQVKMIYIDPPYNTGNDSFIYPDKFSETKEEYLSRIGEKADDGNLMKEGYFRKNSRESGQYHSNWLSMMLPRLYLARNLLKDDGVIFISIDDYEQTNLKLLMDEVFGEENFLQVLVWKRHAGGGNDSKFFATDHEYILVYAKDQVSLENLKIPLSDEDKKEYKYKDQHYETFGPYKLKSFRRMREDDPRPTLTYDILTPDGEHIRDTWKWEESRFLSALKDNKTQIRKDRNGKWQVEYKIYLYDADGLDERTKVPRSLLTDIERNSEGKKQLSRILGDNNIFNNPKPIGLIKYLMYFGTHKNNSIVLDFFSGSGTTAQAVMELNEEDNGNRRYICVQLPEKTEETSDAYKTGYKTIAEITQARIQKVIEKIKQQREEQGTLLDEAKPKLGYRKYKLAGSNFKQWRGDIPQTAQDIETLLDKIEQVEYSNAEPQAMLWELLLKNGYSLTEQVKVIQAGNTPIYLTANQHLAIVLEAYNEQVQAELLTIKPKQVITLDSLFKGQDMAKANYQLKLKDNDIEFKTI